MDVRDSFKNATRAILAAKMRSFLTMLGIIIGIKSCFSNFKILGSLSILNF